MKIILTLILITCILQISLSQSVTVGYYGGIAFSDSHGRTNSGRSISSAIPITGVLLQYSVSPVLSFGTGLDYTKHEYGRKDYIFRSNQIPLDNSYRITGPTLTLTGQHWSFDFLRIPVYLTLSTPTRLQLSISAGFFISFQTRHDSWFMMDYPYNPYYPYYSYSQSLIYDDEYEPPRHDNGMFYAVSLFYPLKEDFKVFASGRYFIGHKNFLDNYRYLRTGASEVTFGLSYSGFFNSAKRTEKSSFKDTSMQRFQILPHTGVSFSFIKNSKRPGSYKSLSAVMAGIRVEYRLDNTVSLVSGIGFERTGYHFNDSSAQYFRYTEGSNELVKTRVDLDYAHLPLLLKLRIGSSYKVFFEGGPVASFNLNDRVTGDSYYVDRNGSNYSVYHVSVYDDIEGEIRNFRINWLLGTGIEFRLWKNKSFYAGVNYMNGEEIFVSDDHTDILKTDSRLRTGSVAINAGIVIPVISNY